MNAPEDYCELCDLPRTQCVHGRPPAKPKEVIKSPPKPKKRAATRGRSAAVPGRRVARRWTPPDVFKPLILTALERAGGELDADELFLELEILAEGHLVPGDSETTPQGELRWRYAARRARVALIDEGLMTRGKAGVWQLARPHQGLD